MKDVDISAKHIDRESRPATVDVDSHLALTHVRWSVTRPSVLVVACSDGRLQESLDDFLDNRLGIRDYDRLFIPGGSGALAPGGHEYMRADHFRKELLFLVRAHGTSGLILIAHGAAADGPADATCAHYRRLMPSAPLAQVRQQQLEDIRYFTGSAKADLTGVQISAYRAEVAADLSVAYVPVA